MGVVGPDFGFDDTSLAGDRFACIEWRSGLQACAADEIEIRTFLYFGDATDNDNGGGNSPGDDLTLSNQPFAFVVP